MATTRKQRRSLVFLMSVVVVFYGFVSLGIGIATADKCGGYDAPKTWSIAPPTWVCQ